jgi:hypothetical protein
VGIRGRLSGYGVAGDLGVSGPARRRLKPPTRLDRIWNAIGFQRFVLFGGALLLATAYIVDASSPSAADRRAQARARCRSAYDSARSIADSLRTDVVIVTPGSSKTGARDETCAELRRRGEL